MKTRCTMWLAVVACAGVCVDGYASSVDVGFVRVGGNGAPNIADQLRLTVSDVSGQSGKVDLTLRNVVGTASNVTEIYFADGSILGSVAIAQQGTAFVAGSGNLPGASTLEPLFTATRSFRTGVSVLPDDGTPATPAGLDAATDFVTFRFALKNGATVNDVLDALAGSSARFGSLRVGVVARLISGNPGSDSFVNSLLIVPLPPAAWAGAAGLAAVGGAAWVRRRNHSRAMPV